MGPFPDHGGGTIENGAQPSIGQLREQRLPNVARKLARANGMCNGTAMK